jgi:hypothetical protein
MLDVRKIYSEIAAQERVKPVGPLLKLNKPAASLRLASTGDRRRKTGASVKYLSEVVAANTRRVCGERGNFYPLRRHLMANVAINFGMLVSLVIEGRAFARGLRPAGLGSIGLRPLKIRKRGFFRVRRQPQVSSSHQQTRQSEYALLYSRHRQVYPPSPVGRPSGGRPLEQLAFTAKVAP